MQGLVDAFTDVPDTAVKTSSVDGEPGYLVTDNDGDLIAVSQRTGLPRAATQADGSVRISYDDVQAVTVSRDARTMAEIAQDLQKKT
jgi:hypothetical protein